MPSVGSKLFSSPLLQRSVLITAFFALCASTWKVRPLRGFYGQNQWLADKLYRSLFVSSLAGPCLVYILNKYSRVHAQQNASLVGQSRKLYWFIWLIVVLSYSYSFLDGSECNGGRPNNLILWWWRKTAQRIWTKRVPLKLVLAGSDLVTSQERAGINDNSNNNNRVHRQEEEKEEEEEEEKNGAHIPPGQYVFGFHPHGILPLGTIMNYTSKKWNRLLPNVPRENTRLLVASFCFYLPILREIYLALGFVDASRISAQRVLKQGHSLCVFPGGASEAMYSQPNANDQLVLTSRTGFVKLAIQNGVDGIVPVFTFGETDTTNAKMPVGSSSWRLQKFIQKIIGLNTPSPNLIPHPIPCTTVVGKPMLVPHDPDPSPALVEATLERYKKCVRELYDLHAPLYNTHRPDKKLVFLTKEETQMP